jgi:phosphomannomutase
VITASHNPADYNGYKVYGPSGAQIIAPRDEAIARAIAVAPPARSIGRESLDEGRKTGHFTVLTGEIEEAYVAGVQKLMLAPRARPPLSIVYTPLHGVGYRIARRVLVAAGFSEPMAVDEQVAPDPAFPTTPFPNPEEPGVLDLALALAREKDADLVLANDPDADRLAVAIKDENGSFIQLSGNQVGVLLGHYLLTEDRGPGDRAIITTIVSSPMLGDIAAQLGVYHEETLTGFKWIASRATELAASGKRFVFGYEEALGYAVGNLVRDKDGLSAGALFAEVVAVQKARGTSVFAYLSDLYRRFGFYASAQRSILMPGNEGATRIEQLMNALRSAPPNRIGSFAVLERRDHAIRIRARVDGATESLALPASNVLVFLLEGESRVVIRPSGTEPKLKVYLDHRELVRQGEAVAATELRSRSVISLLENAVRSLIPPADR